MIDINRTKLSKESAEQFFQKWAQPEAAPVAQTAPMDDDFTRAAFAAGYNTPESLAQIRQWASSQILKDSWYGKTADETYKTIGWHLGGAGIGAAIGGLLGGGRGALAGTLLGTLAFAVMKIFKVGEPEALRFVQDSIATRKLDTLKEALKTEPAKYRQEIAALESSPATIYQTAMDIVRNPESLNLEERQDLFSNTLPRAAEAMLEEVKEKSRQEALAKYKELWPSMNSVQLEQIADNVAQRAFLEKKLAHVTNMQEIQKRRVEASGVEAPAAMAPDPYTDQKADIQKQLDNLPRIRDLEYKDKVTQATESARADLWRADQAEPTAGQVSEKARLNVLGDRAEKPSPPPPSTGGSASFDMDRAEEIARDIGGTYSAEDIKSAVDDVRSGRALTQALGIRPTPVSATGPLQQKFKKTFPRIGPTVENAKNLEDTGTAK